MNELRKKQLRSGITTGASAAAAARAAVLYLYKKQNLKKITVYNPSGLAIDVPVKAQQLIDNNTAAATVIKDGGDDPDVTHGLQIVVEVQRSGTEIIIKGGTGVGTVTRPGLQIPVGEPAINPVPREMIKAAVTDLLPPGQGLIITVSVPNGEKVAHKTLNPRLGIIGGISILGTTGIVRPMSEEAFKNSLVPLIQMALAHNYKHITLTPGRMGVRFAVDKYGLPEEAVVEMSNFVGFMLEACVEKGIEQVMLMGHHGKIIKIAAGIFHTHSRVADGRLETLAAYAGLAGADQKTIAAVLNSNTAEAAVQVLEDEGIRDQVFFQLAQRASRRAEDYVRGKLKVGTVLLSMDGNILGLDNQAKVIGRKLGWKYLC
ncbi:cobalt-precorrin-5B (C(1))-methyltransferase CbiD [Desulfolucanica intricata]|uniref:cobalt-precorrin-5B (C(1))-methyltransferase CbiD n=1 Tax=Desulfolucanica intricata TaxID=1285191 RepID=UPI000833DD99|nr:cobalt-precorrin-5B (C(1))-methyltransferase CbiD [Desulfolucanica intricata]